MHIQREEHSQRMPFTQTEGLTQRFIPHASSLPAEPMLVWRTGGGGPGGVGEGHGAGAVGAEGRGWMPEMLQKQNLCYTACFHFSSHISFIAIFMSIAAFLYIFLAFSGQIVQSLGKIVSMMS